jgi:hypothetical protein
MAAEHTGSAFGALSSHAFTVEVKNPGGLMDPFIPLSPQWKLGAKVCGSVEEISWLLQVLMSFYRRPLSPRLSVNSLPLRVSNQSVFGPGPRLAPRLPPGTLPPLLSLPTKTGSLLLAAGVMRSVTCLLLVGLQLLSLELKGGSGCPVPRSGPSGRISCAMSVHRWNGPDNWANDPRNQGGWLGHLFLPLSHTLLGRPGHLFHAHICSCEGPVVL